MKKFYWLTCKNTDCPETIVLPLPILHEKPASRLLWPRDGKPRNFLCLHCNHAHEYTRSEVHSGPGDTRLQDQRDEIDGVYRAEAQCGISNCGLPIYLQLTAHEFAAGGILPADWFPTEKHGRVRCSSGHLTGRIVSGSFESAVPDPDWK